MASMIFGKSLKIYASSHLIARQNVCKVCQILKFHTSVKYRLNQASKNEWLNRPLQGIKVLDLTRVLAGPYCSMLLGDLGAEVIKIERPGTGDDTRLWGPPFIEGTDGKKYSAYFLSVNRNKKSVAIDFNKEEGCKVVKELASQCDVLVENFVPGNLSKKGLGYDQLKDVAPRLIYTSVTGFGQSGPYSERGGYDNVAAAIGGLMHITGPEDGDPCRTGVALTDIGTGLYAHGAILAALIHRQSTGRGQHIDCNLLNTEVASMSHIASNYLNCGVDAKRWGTGHVSIVPYQTFKATDGHIMIGAGNEKLFTELCQRIGLEKLLEDERYTTNAGRVNNRQTLIQKLSDRFAEKSLSEWLEILEGSVFPYGPVNNMQQVFADPQVQHNQMIQTMNHHTFGEIRVPGPAVEYTEGSLTPQRPPPLLGEHTEDVLREHLSYHTEQINSLRSQGVIT